ncbi:MAG: RIP metalloprotease [Clostridia bacterium]|nr:RIP metalloprotease [Clostridia bacterium]
MTIFYVLLAILLLGILVTVHEFGHFVAARITGIAVNEFAIGFGPKLLGWKSKKHETQFSIRLIPLGGYCAFYGEDDVEGNILDDPRAYNRQSVWKRMFTVIMGPMMNFVLAFVVLFGYFMIGGVYDPAPDSLYVYGVEADTPAQAAGLQPGDVILAINTQAVGRELTGESLRTALDEQAALTGKVNVTVQRGQEQLVFPLTPQFNEAEQRYLMGITLSYQLSGPRTPGVGEALQLSWYNCVSAGSAITNALKNLVTTGEGFEETGGPVAIIHIVTEQTQSGGLEAYVNLLIVISINLGIMNLLPIPGLDGSRFLFMVVEAIRRKPIAPQKEAMVHMAGMLLLVAFMIFFTFRDVIRIFQ